MHLKGKPIYQMRYGQIRYLMRRLKTSLESKLKQGKPPTYCRMCHSELLKIIGRQLERQLLEKKTVNGRDTTAHRSDRGKYFTTVKDNIKARKCRHISIAAAEGIHADKTQ